MAAVPAYIYLRRTAKPAPCVTNVDTDPLLDRRLDKHDIAELSAWGVQPGAWWKDESSWVPYDKHVAQKIMKAEKFGVPKIHFNKSAAAYPQCISVQGPSSSRSSVTYAFKRPNTAPSPFSGSNCGSTGASEYEVDLIAMEEVHLESGVRREIKIVKVSPTGCLFRIFSTSNDSGADFSVNFTTSSGIVRQNMEGEKYGVSWKDDIQGWCLYNDNCQRAIWSAWTKGDDLVPMKAMTSAKDSDLQTDYIIDLKRMQQINTTNGQRKPIQIATWVSSSSFPHMWIGDSCQYLAREIEVVNFPENNIMLYKLVLSRLLSPQYAKDAISKHVKPHTLESLKLDSYRNLAKTSQWYRFLHSFMHRVNETPDCLDHLRRFALNPNGPHHPNNPFTFGNTNGLLRFVSGAPSHEQSGTETSASTNDNIQLDWFGLSSAITEFHCKPIAHGVVSMLVFLVMMPKNYRESPERAVVVKKVIEYLPVASVTVRIDDSSLGPACSLWEDKDEDNYSLNSQYGERAKLVQGPDAHQLAER